MKTIAVVNQKGGCGKTTVSINLASALAELGQRVLLVDMDAQSHCAVGLAVPEEQIEQSIYDVLISKSRNEPMKLTEILWQISDGLELAPASIDLSAFDQQMNGFDERECCLKETLDEIKNGYDFVVIDCPPAVSLLTFNALRAANEVIVPVETGYFALHGLSKQLETLSVLTKRTGQDVKVKVLATMYDVRTKMAREILADLRNHFGQKMFDTVIAFNTKIKEASSFGQPISEYDPASKGQQDFHALATEIISSQTKHLRHEYVNTLAEQLEMLSSSAEELLDSVKASSENESEQIIQTEENNSNENLDAFEQAIALEELPIHSDEQAHEYIEEEEIELVEENEPLAEFDSANQQENLDVRLSQYYGVEQIEDAIAFVSLYPRATTVQIAGDFNNWQPDGTCMKRLNDEGIWQARLKLPAGRYRYRLVVDGKWQQDPYNEVTEMNPFGELNSVFVVE